MTSRVCRPRKGVLGRSAEIASAGRFGRVPALAVVDAPGMDHDDGRLRRSQAIRHLDDAASVVRKPPGPHVEIGRSSSTRVGAS